MYDLTSCPSYVAQSVLRARICAVVEDARFQRIVIGLIVFNAATLGLETCSGIMADWGEVLTIIDGAILALFVIELALRMITHGLGLFRDPWSAFDFAVIAVALMPSTGALSELRAAHPAGVPFDFRGARPTFDR